MDKFKEIFVKFFGITSGFAGILWTIVRTVAFLAYAGWYANSWANNFVQTIADKKFDDYAKEKKVDVERVNNNLESMAKDINRIEGTTNLILKTLLERK